MNTPPVHLTSVARTIVTHKMFLKLGKKYLLVSPLEQTGLGAGPGERGGEQAESPGHYIFKTNQ